MQWGPQSTALHRVEKHTMPAQAAARLPTLSMKNSHSVSVVSMRPAALTSLLTALQKFSFSSCECITQRFFPGLGFWQGIA